jgi:hypothetical protein
MRTIPALILAILWIGCGPSNRGDDDDGDSGGPPDSCEGLRCAVVDCAKSGRPETSVSGTVFAPNGTLPLFGVTVYVPNRDPGFFVDGAQCSRCAAQLPGDPIAQAQSDTSGKFTLTGVPVGDNIPLIITIGKWRRQVRIPVVSECTDTPLAATETSLPKRKSEGEMPKIAMVTGGCDALECLVRKRGIADSEFTNDANDGRVHLYTANGATRTVTNMTFAPAINLWNNIDKLKQYDLAMYSCECSQQAAGKPQSAMDTLKMYADLGGRAFLSHYHSVWISGENANPAHAPQVWPTIATCRTDTTPSGVGVIDQLNNPRGSAFASWMVAVQGSTTPGQLPILEARQTCSMLDNSKAERWIYMQNGSTEVIQNFQFTTPNEVIKEDRCGKVVFSDMHVASGSSSSSGTPFPGGCSTNPMTPQEKALAFMFFDIASCVGPIF